MENYDPKRWDAVLAFATLAHGEQLRKYIPAGHDQQVDEYAGITAYDAFPYVFHCVRVAKTISLLPSATMEMVEAAMLHDTVEDTEIVLDDIRAMFGNVVALYVELLTDPPLSFGNRAARKAEVARKMLTASWHVKSIKLADLLDNADSIFEHDKNFAKVFFAEKSLLLDNLLGGDQGLWNRARAKCDAATNELFTQENQ